MNLLLVNKLQQIKTIYRYKINQNKILSTSLMMKITIIKSIYKLNRVLSLLTQILQLIHLIIYWLLKIKLIIRNKTTNRVIKHMRHNEIVTPKM